MNLVYIMLGSNLENRKVNLEKARTYISGTIGEIDKLSAIYETEPWGISAQPAFLNQALLVRTTLSAQEILTSCINFQLALNLVKKEKYGPRLIDIDLIFFNDCISDSENLTLPHPRMHERNFVLIPLAEIASSYFHPVLNKTIHQLQTECPDKGHVRSYED